MNYAEAAKIRKSSFGNLYADRVIQGQNPSARSVVSEKLAARAIGLKQTFGLMNIAKVLTLGSNWAPALVGSIIGANKNDIRHVTGRRQTSEKQLAPRSESGSNMTPVNAVLEKMVNFMHTSESKESEQLETLRTYEEFQSKIREDRHHDVMSILVNATAKKRRAEKQMKAETQKREQRERDKKAMGEKVPEVAGAKPPAPAPKPAAPTPKPATPAPTAPVPKPSAPAPKPPAPTAKPPVSSATRTGAIEAAKTATKVSVGSIVGGLAAVGVTNSYAQAAVLANVKKESGFNLVAEDMNYSTVKRLREVFPSRTSNKTDDELKIYLKNPQGLAEFVYGGRMKNTEPGDGYKYRGRGSLQLTGKQNYETFGKLLNVDLVTNPDLVLQPEINTKIVALYTQQTLGKKVNEFKTQEEANRAVTQAIAGPKLNLDKGYGASLLEKVNKASADYTTEKIQLLSTENADMKKEMSKGSGASVIMIDNTLNAAQKTVNNTSVPENNINPRLRR